MTSDIFDEEEDFQPNKGEKARDVFDIDDDNTNYNNEPEKKEPTLLEKLYNFGESTAKGVKRKAGIGVRSVVKAAGAPAELALLPHYARKGILKHTIPDYQEEEKPEYVKFLEQYTPEALAHNFDVATEGEYVPETPFEKVQSTIGEFGATGPLFEGKAALQGPGLLRNALAGLGAGAAEQLGGGGLAQGTAAVAGASAPSIASNLNPTSILRGIAKTVGKQAGNQTKAPIRKALLQENIKNAPASLQTNSNLIKKSEKVVTQNPFAGKKFEDTLENVNKKMAKNFEQKVGNGIQDTFESAMKAGQSSQDFLDYMYKGTEDFFGKAYEGIKKKAKDWKIEPKNYEKTLNELENSLSKTLSESPEKASLLNDIAKMKENLYEARIEKINTFNPKTKKFDQKTYLEKIPKKVGLEDLLNTRADLNAIYNRTKEFKGAQKFRKTFPQAINKDLEALSSKHPEVYAELKELDKAYGVHKDNFNNKVIKAVRNQEKPEVVLGLIRQPSDLEKVGKILNINENGQKLFKDIKQAKLQQIFSEQFLDARNGLFDYQRYSSLLDYPHINKWIEKLASPEQTKAIRNLEKISDGFVKGEKYLTKNTELMSKLKGAGDIAQISNAVVNLAKGNFGNVILSGLGIMGPRMLAKIYSDPELIKIMLNTAKAGKSNNIKVYMNGMREISKRLAQTAVTGQEE